MGAIFFATFFPLALGAFFLSSAFIANSDTTLATGFLYLFFFYALIFTLILFYTLRHRYATHTFRNHLLITCLFLLSVLPSAIWLTSYEDSMQQEGFLRVPFEDMRLQAEGDRVTITGKAELSPGLGKQELSFTGNQATIKQDAAISEPMLAAVYTFHRRIYPMLGYITAYRGVPTGYVIYLPG